MRLKAFEAHGFKSFADKVGIKFEQGITAIVGPNGSGKSNISDAVRWVMGEQSVKYLRGSKMEDVIFAGSGARRPLGMAEVSLTFDNTDHSLPLDFDEVSIRRRVFRSGDSEYYINNKSCRLKDVVTLLADTGLGRGSMAIIGQNRIDEILNSKPEDRRALFEEAAGIAKYRMRKKEALRRLEDTTNNLVRINDIKSEIESRIEPLKTAAATTESYLQLAASLRQVQVTQFVHRIENIELIKNKLATKVSELEEQAGAVEVQVQAKEAASLALKVELDKLNEEYNDLQKRLAEKENSIERLHGQEAVLSERIQQSEKHIERTATQHTRLQEQIALVQENLGLVGKKYDSVDAEKIQLQEQADACGAQKASVEAQILELEQQLEEYKSNAFAGLQEMVNVRNEIRSLETQQELYQRRRQQMRQEATEGESLLQELVAKHTGFVDEQATLQENTKQLQAEITALLEGKNEHDTKLGALRQERALRNRDLEKCEARLNVLENMQREHEGYGRGVKTLLEAHESWTDNIYGVVGDLITVEERYITAIETALGSALQNVVTKDAKTAKAAIYYLKEQKGGRATFLPLDNLRFRENSDREAALTKISGILGWAADFVACRQEVTKAMRMLLGRVLIAENLDAALAAAKQSDFKVRVVTLEGDVVAAGGSMSGGQKKNGQGSFLSRKQEIAHIEAQVQQSNTQLLELQEKLEALERVAEENANRVLNHRSALQKNAIRAAELVAFLDRSATEKAQQAERLELLQAEQRAKAEESQQQRQKLVQLRPQLNQLESSDVSGKQKAEAMQKSLGQARSKQVACNAEHQDAVVALESAKERLLVLAERVQQLDADVERLEAELAENEADQQKTVELIRTTKLTQAALAKQQKELLQELKATGSGKEEFLARRTSIIDQQNAAQVELDEVKKQQIILQQKMHNAELEKVKQQTEYENALEQMTTSHKLTPAEARTNGIVLELSDTALNKQERALQKSIEELGPINMGAVEEYKAVSERFEFLHKQYSDLCEAKEQLEGVIGGINTDMSKRYNEAFAQINLNFNHCYEKLFGGGHAELVMQEGEDVLETGVEIIVQPPGKKLQNMFLLSGGERALTVIALLFALLSYKAAPFCFLDEIDAALDEANISRFANFIADYSGNTQFIIITHRKGTMEAANVLHGVTMEESGVSRLLSVKLSDIQE